MIDELRPLLERVRFAVFDFDGVFTDNRVWVNERGEEMLAFSRSDGLGLRRLDEVGVQYLIVSMEQNPIVGARARKLRADRRLRRRLDVVERDEVLERERTPQPSSDEPLELVRRQPAVRRRLDGQVGVRQDVAELELARGHDLLPHLLERVGLDR